MSEPWTRGEALAPLGNVKRQAKSKKRVKSSGSAKNQGQAWEETPRDWVTVRLPAAVELEIRRHTLVKGDLASIVRFALSVVPHDSVKVLAARESGIQPGRPTQIYIGAEARQKVYEWAQSKGVSVNAVLAALLTEFLKLIERKPKLAQDVERELRARRGL